MRLDFWNNKKRELLRDYRVWYRAKLKNLAEHNAAEEKLNRLRYHIKEKGDWAYIAYESVYNDYKKYWSEFLRCDSECWKIKTALKHY